MADMPQTASRYTARMPHTKQFNSMILAMKSYYIRVVHELLDTYYVTMESFMNSQYEGLNASTDAIIKSVSSSQDCSR
jgi:hypothetical protein